MAKMTKKELIDLMSYFSLIAISKRGNKIMNDHLTPEQIDKMMRLVVEAFKGDEKKAEAFILEKFQKLVNKLDKQEVSGDSKNHSNRRVEL